MSSLKHTPLFERHRALGAQLAEFAGFEMPIRYGSIRDEHAAVRDAVGVFDVSHMGQVWLRGPGAVASAERLVTCPVASLRPGRVRYGVLCNEQGGSVDDVTIYRVADDVLFFCVNAANIEKDYRWIVRHTQDAEIQDASDRTGLLALQGPASCAVLNALCELSLDELKRFRFVQGKLAGVEALISRTGYTGSDGFELYLDAGDVETVFDSLLEVGGPHGLVPAGLGARDTLRLEAALPLYGHELDDETSPLEAGLDRFVKLDTGGFIGADALLRQREAGLTRQLVGFQMLERGIARAGYELANGEAVVGRVTSGGPSPSLDKAIGLGFVPPPLAEPGSPLNVMIRGRAVRAEVVETPFVQKVRTGTQGGGRG